MKTPTTTEEAVQFWAENIKLFHPDDNPKDIELLAHLEEAWRAAWSLVNPWSLKWSLDFDLEEEVRSPFGKVEQMLKTMPDALPVLLPAWFYEAVDMCQNEPELYGETTPAVVALNAYFDNLQDGDKYDALDQISGLILNLLDHFKEALL
tara:strand:- start:424 stop:873 length:450 start_codon:yes stop_codon:yes gene_type:complete